MNSMLLNHLTEIVVLDFHDDAAEFRASVGKIPQGLPSDPYEIIIHLMPCYDNIFAAETFFNASVYQLWQAHPEEDQGFMEKYTDEILKLAGKVLRKMEKLNMYNQEGELLYVFESRLGNGIVMRLKALPLDHYQLF